MVRRRGLCTGHKGGHRHNGSYVVCIRYRRVGSLLGELWDLFDSSCTKSPPSAPRRYSSELRPGLAIEDENKARWEGTHRQRTWLID